MKLLLVAALLIAAPLASGQDAAPVSMAHAELEWTEMIPGVSFAAAHGDWSSEAHGKFVRIDPGIMAPLHVHTHAYHGVMLSGTLTHPYAGEDNPPELGPGAYFYAPGGAAHVTGCISDEPCVFYTHGDDLWDIAVVED